VGVYYDAATGAAAQRQWENAVGRCRLTVSKSVLKAKRVWFHRLKHKYDKRLSRFAFKFNLRHYNAYLNFDSLPNALVTLFVVSTLDGYGQVGLAENVKNLLQRILNPRFLS
jgi:hypothetical protein